MLQNQRPSNFSAKAEIAVVLPFLQEGKVLLLQRLPTHPQANMWCAPGGKIQSDETSFLAAARELREETGIAVDCRSLICLGKFYVQYSNGDFVVHLFKTHLNAKDIDIKIKKEEHQEYYFCPLQDIHTLSLTPGLDQCFELARVSVLSSGEN